MGKRRKIQKNSESYGYVDPYKGVDLLNIDDKVVQDRIKKTIEQNKKRFEEHKKLEKVKQLEEQKKYEEEKKFQEEKKSKEENDDEMVSYDEIKIDSNKETRLKDDFSERDTKEETKDEPVSQEKNEYEKPFSIFDSSIFSDDEERKMMESIIKNDN